MVLVAAVCVVGLALLPYLIGKRTAITQSREFDRFSPHMRLLRTTPEPRAGEDCPMTSPRILSGETHVIMEAGGAMSHSTQTGRRPAVGVRAARESNVTLKQAAQLRARRAARLSRERAAGQRRLIMSGVAAGATVLVAILAGVSVIGWLWVLAPAGALVGSLGASRYAAVRSQAESEVEDAELRRLRKLLHDERNGLATPPAARQEAAAVAQPAPVATVPEPTPVVEHEAIDLDEELDTDSQGIPLHVSKDADADEGVSNESSLQAQPAVVSEQAAQDQARAAIAAQHRAGRTWTVSPVPRPTYASRGRVAGRAVHPDTDLKGIPKVAAAVPARPIATGEVRPGMRTTAQIANAQPVLFDLDAVLEARRAQ